MAAELGAHAVDERRDREPLRGSAAHLVIEHDGFHAGLVRHAADVVRRRVRLGDVAEDALGIAGVGRFLLARRMLFSYAPWSNTSQTNTSAPRARRTMFAEYAVSPEKQIERVLVSKR